MPKKTKKTQALPKILVVLGPTAVGKSDLAVELAVRFNGEIISADSRQVYKGLDIGSGKITKREMKGVPHYLLSVADPGRQYSAARFKLAAEKAITDITNRGKLPIICGGTGFYIDTVLGSISLPEVPPNYTLRKQLEKKITKQLFVILKKLDSNRAKIVDPQNPVRLIRAIEIAKVLGSVPKQKQGQKYDVLKIGIRLPELKLKQNIHRRLLARMKKGMVAEARRLHNPQTGKELSWKRMEELGLEYRYLAYFLQNKISKEEMLERIEIESMQYTKRQMRWWKRDKDIKWFLPQENAKMQKCIQKFLTS